MVRLPSNNEALPTIKKELGTTYPLGHTAVHGTRWDAPEVAEGAGYCLWSFKGHGMFLMTGEGQTSHPSSGRARRGIKGTAGQSASLQSLGKL